MIHNYPEFMTRFVLSAKLGISERSLSRFEVEGMPVVYIGKLPRYDYDKVIKWFKKHYPKGRK